MEAYKLHDFGHDGIRVAAAVEEGRLASEGRSRMAEPGGRKLAWIKAVFAVGVAILTIVVALLGIGIWWLIKLKSARP